MTKAEQIIEKLSGKRKPCHCSGYPSHDDYCQAKYKPILIGDCLEAINNDDFNDITADQIIIKWQPLGFTKSLQEIAEDVDWGKSKECLEVKECIYKSHLKLEAQELLEFIHSIFITE